MSEKETCIYCGRDLPANWPMPYHTSCLKDSRKKPKTPKKPTIKKQIKDHGGVTRFREQGTLDDPKWAVLVYVFGHRVFGDGYKQEVALWNAVAKLPPEHAKKFVR